MQASDASIGVLDRPVGADGVSEALGRGLGAEQVVAGVDDALPEVGEMEAVRSERVENGSRRPRQAQQPS